MSIMRIEKLNRNNVNPQGLLIACGYTHIADHISGQVFLAVTFSHGYMYAQFSTHKRLAPIQLHSEYVKIGE